MVSVMATWRRRVRVVGRVLSRMPATVLLAAVGLAFALTALFNTGSSTTAPDATEVQLVAYGNGGGQCTGPSCGGGPQWNDPAQGTGSAFAGQNQNSGGALDWASGLLGLDNEETAKTPQPGNPEQGSGPITCQAIGVCPPPGQGSGGIAGWANQLVKDLTKTITDALGKIGDGNGSGGKPPVNQPDQADAPDAPDAPDQMNAAQLSGNATPTAQPATQTQNQAQATPDSGNGTAPRGERPDQAVLNGGANSSSSGQGQRTRTGTQNIARFATNLNTRIRQAISRTADTAASQGHEQRMGWLASAHGPKDPHRPATNGTRQAADGEPHQTRLTGAGMTVPTNDGNNLTITPTTHNPNSKITPDLANGRYLITAKNAQAPGSYDFRLDMPEGSQTTPNEQGGVDITNGGELIQTIAPPWAKDANGEALPTRFEVNGNTLTQHVAFNDKTAFPVLADPATKKVAPQATQRKATPQATHKPVTTAAAASSRPRDNRPVVVIDAKGKNFNCKNCTGSSVNIGNGTPGPDTGNTKTYTGKNQRIVVINAGPKTIVTGNRNKVTGGNGNNRRVSTHGNNNTVKLGNGNNNRISTGAGNHNTARAGKGHNNRVSAVDGNNNRAIAGPGHNNRVVTGYGNNNRAIAGKGDNNRVSAGKGNHNTALVGNGHNNRVVTGAGSNNLAMAGRGNNNRVTAGGPGNRNTALTGNGNNNRVVVGEGNHNLAGAGAGQNNFTRTGPGNHNKTFTGPGRGSRTQVGSGQGNTANGHKVAPGQTGKFPPRAVPPHTPKPPHTTPKLPRHQQQQQEKKKYGVWWLTPAGVGVDLYNNFPRGVGTYKDAAARHKHWAKHHQTRANATRPQQGPRAKLSTTYHDARGKWRENRAKWYTDQKERLEKATTRFPYNGKWGEWAKKFTPATGVDNLNRTPKATLKQRYAPGVTNKKPDQAIRSFGAKEWARRGLTKVGGLFGAPMAAVDAYIGIKNGESVPHAVGRTGSSLTVGTTAGGLSTAAVAATVPGPGWAVAAGIAVGTYASMAWSRSGAGDEVGKGFEKAGDAFKKGDIHGGRWEATKGIGKGAAKFGAKVGKDIAKGFKAKLGL